MNLRAFYRGGNSKGESGYFIAFDYDAEMVETLKSAIPHIHREWNPDTKMWWVSQDYDETLQRLFSNFYALAHLQGELF